MILMLSQVEDELFRVPRNQFECHSEVFRDMFALPLRASQLRDGGVNLEGSDDSRPIVLDRAGGVTKNAFSALLQVLYPIEYVKEERLLTFNCSDSCFLDFLKPDSTILSRCLPGLRLYPIPALSIQRRKCPL